ncbi:MAG: S8 family peptidase [Candidatus Thiodiazotropha sp.]
MEKLINAGLSLLLFSLIAACGGGGGGGDDTDDTGDDGVRVTVSGKLIVPSFVVTDSDVNDVLTTPVPNQTLVSAQVVPNPVNIGGYANLPREGAPGNLYITGDIDDYFLIDMQAGQTLLLNVADPSSADLDLGLYNLNGDLLDSSVGYTQFESLVVPADGQYYVRVNAFSGASNYLLSVGLTPASGLPTGGLRLSDEFLPGELLVRFNTASLQAKSADPLLARFQVDSQNYGGGVQRLRLNAQTAELASRAADGTQMTDMQQQKLDTLLAIKALRKRDDVDLAEPNFVVRPSLTPDDEYYSLQWHYPQINLPQAWDITTGDNSVIVAVIDSGVLLNHPDMAGQLVAGYDFISDVESAGDGDGIDSDPYDVGDSVQEGVSSSFHGTHVAGTVAALSNNTRGIAGVAWNSRIMPIRVLGKNGGSSLDLAEGIRYAAGLANVSGTVPEQPADIINMSLGGSSDSQLTREAVAAARAAGVIIIAAAGNESTSQLSYPASNPGVVSVSAVDINRDLAFYSNYGSMIDVAAPGGDLRLDLNGDSRPDGILSAGADDSSDSISYQLVFYNGTSMAAPHIAGVAALMKAVYPGLTPAEFDSMLAAGELTNDLGDTGRDDDYGYGLIDAYKAVDAAQQRQGGGGVTVDPTLSVNPQSLSFSHNLQTATLFVEQIGGDLGTVEIAEDIDWLTLQAGQVDSSGYGVYSVVVDRSGVDAGTYSGSIQITAGSEIATVEVIMQVLDVSISGDAGTHYVLLVNNDTDQILQQARVDAVGENASYSFSNVASGNYIIFAGSDMDMDDIICDAGESCGAYASVAQPSIIEVTDSDVTDRDFITSFEYQSPSSSQSFGNSARSLLLRRLDAEQ